MPSINAPTLDQVKLCCRHVVEMMDADITENLAIRMLELMTDNYAKFRVHNQCSPNDVNQFDHWSKPPAMPRLRTSKASPARTYVLNMAHRDGTLPVMCWQRTRQAN